jgi:hypothetical protein
VNARYSSGIRVDDRSAKKPTPPAASSDDARYGKGMQAPGPNDAQGNRTTKESDDIRSTKPAREPEPDKSREEIISQKLRDTSISMEERKALQLEAQKLAVERERQLQEADLRKEAELERRIIQEEENKRRDEERRDDEERRAEEMKRQEEQRQEDSRRWEEDMAKRELDIKRKEEELQALETNLRRGDMPASPGGGLLPADLRGGPSGAPGSPAASQPPGGMGRRDFGGSGLSPRDGGPRDFRDGPMGRGGQYDRDVRRDGPPGRDVGYQNRGGFDDRRSGDRFDDRRMDGGRDRFDREDTGPANWRGSGPGPMSGPGPADNRPTSIQQRPNSKILYNPKSGEYEEQKDDKLSNLEPLKRGQQPAGSSNKPNAWGNPATSQKAVPFPLNDPGVGPDRASPRGQGPGSPARGGKGGDDRSNNQAILRKPEEQSWRKQVDEKRKKRALEEETKSKERAEKRLKEKEERGPRTKGVLYTYNEHGEIVNADPEQMQPPRKGGKKIKATLQGKKGKGGKGAPQPAVVDGGELDGKRRTRGSRGRGGKDKGGAPAPPAPIQQSKGKGGPGGFGGKGGKGQMGKGVQGKGAANHSFGKGQLRQPQIGPDGVPPVGSGVVIVGKQEGIIQENPHMGFEEVKSRGQQAAEKKEQRLEEQKQQKQHAQQAARTKQAGNQHQQQQQQGQKGGQHSGGKGNGAQQQPQQGAAPPQAQAQGGTNSMGILPLGGQELFAPAPLATNPPGNCWGSPNPNNNAAAAIVNPQLGLLGLNPVATGPATPRVRIDLRQIQLEETMTQSPTQAFGVGLGGSAIEDTNGKAIGKANKRGRDKRGNRGKGNKQPQGMPGQPQGMQQAMGGKAGKGGKQQPMRGNPLVAANNASNASMLGVGATEWTPSSMGGADVLSGSGVPGIPQQQNLPQQNIALRAEARNVPQGNSQGFGNMGSVAPTAAQMMMQQQYGLGGMPQTMPTAGGFSGPFGAQQGGFTQQGQGQQRQQRGGHQKGQQQQQQQHQQQQQQGQRQQGRKGQQQSGQGDFNNYSAPFNNTLSMPTIPGGSNPFAQGQVSAVLVDISRCMFTRINSHLVFCFASLCTAGLCGDASCDATWAGLRWWRI